MGLLCFFTIVSGCHGVFWSSIAPVTAEIVGLQELPSALSMIWLTIVPATLFSEPIALALTQDGTANPYTDTQVFVGVVFIVGLIPMLLLRGWKIKQISRAETDDDGVLHGECSQTKDDFMRTENTRSNSSTSSGINKLFANMFARRIV
jgi:hypothetical protein